MTNWEYLSKNVGYKDKVPTNLKLSRTASLLNHCSNFPVHVPDAVKHHISN